MKLLRLFRKVSSLVGHRAQCSPIERLLSCSTRRISSFADWDSCPVNNRVYFSRKMNPADLVDVIKHFEENPIFESILSNKLVGKATSSKAFDKSTSSNAPHKNPFLEAISKMNLLMMSRAASVAFRSLPELYLENHLRGIFLGARISLSNVRIHKPSGKFVFFDNEQGMSQELPLVKHSGDLKGLAGLVREIIDILYPGITLPSDLAHWLSLLEEAEPTLWLVMYHPVFLSLKGRFLYHVALDQATRKEFERGDRVKLMEILRKLAKFKGFFGLAALHELLKSQMDKSRKKSKTRSKRKKAAAAAAAAVPGSRQAAAAPGSPQSAAAAAAAVPGSRQAAAAPGSPQSAAAPGSPQSAAAAAAVPGSRQTAAAPGSPQSVAAPGSPQSAAAAVAALNVRSGKRKRAKSRKSCSKRQSNGTSSTGNTIQSAEQITFDKQKQELSDGRDVVSFIRDCPVHGCENMCVHFLFVEVSMLSQEAIVQLVHFIFRDYGHEALQAFFNAGLSGVVGIEGLFGEEPNTWREAMLHQTTLKDTSS